LSLEPRDSASLDYVKLWDSGCVKTRLEELTRAFIQKFTHAEVEKIARKARKAFKPVPAFELPKGKNLREVYGEKAKKKAEKVLEQERQNYVDARAEKDKNVIAEVKRKLRFMVWSVNEEGQPEKLKVIVERVTTPNYRGDYHTHDIQYVGDHDKERLRQINTQKHRLEQLRTYAPYYSKEIKKLYEEAEELATLEDVRKEG